MEKEPDELEGKEYWREGHKLDESLSPLMNYFIRKMEKESGGDPNVSADAEVLILTFLEGKTSVEIAGDNATSEKQVVTQRNRAVNRIINVIMDANLDEIGVALNGGAAEKDDGAELDVNETLKKIVRLLNEMQYSKPIKEKDEKLLGDSTLACAGFKLSEGKNDVTRFQKFASNRVRVFVKSKHKGKYDRIGNVEDVAEEVTQDVLLGFWETKVKRDRYKSFRGFKEQLKKLFYKITYYKWVDLLRRILPGFVWPPVRPIDPGDKIPDTGPNPEDDEMRKETIEGLRKLVVNLPAEDQLFYPLMLLMGENKCTRKELVPEFGSTEKKIGELKKRIQEKIKIKSLTKTENDFESDKIRKEERERLLRAIGKLPADDQSFAKKMIEDKRIYYRELIPEFGANDQDIDERIKRVFKLLRSILGSVDE